MSSLSSHMQSLEAIDVAVNTPDDPRVLSILTLARRRRMAVRLPQRQELHFGTAAQHHTRNVPIAAPDDTAGAVVESLIGRRFDSVGEIVICDPTGRLLGLVNIEDHAD